MSRNRTNVTKKSITQLSRSMKEHKEGCDNYQCRGEKKKADLL